MSNRPFFLARKLSVRVLLFICMSMFVSSCGADSLPQRLFKAITNAEDDAIKVTVDSEKEAEELSKKIMEVIKDPKIQIGENKDQPSSIDITLFADTSANMNMDGEPVPLDVWIFQLQEIDKFVNLTFEELTGKPKKNLGSHFLDVKEVQVDPGKSRILKGLEIENSAQFIGVVGGYADIDRVNWLNFEKVKDIGEEYSSVIIMKQSEIFIELHR